MEKISSALAGRTFEPMEYEWNSKDTMLYALGLDQDLLGTNLVGQQLYQTHELHRLDLSRIVLQPLGEQLNSADRVEQIVQKNAFQMLAPFQGADVLEKDHGQLLVI